jgi:hypothetical protein
MNKNLNIAIPVDSRATVRALNDIQKKQLPFAVAQALTQTAAAARRDASKATDKFFDRPTGFTKKAFDILPAGKRQKRLMAHVFIKDWQWNYLQYQVYGGVRYPNRFSIPVPTSNLTDRNRYGNMRRRQIKQMLRDPNVFSGKVRGVGGIWMRTPSGSVRLLVSWESKTTYRKRYPFKKIVRKSVGQNYSRIFRRSLSSALRTSHFKSKRGSFDKWYAQQWGE